METTKRTYALPESILRDFELQVPAGQRSRTISQLMSDWIGARNREALRREIIEGCQAMADHYLEVEREYHPLEIEASRAL